MSNASRIADLEKRVAELEGKNDDDYFKPSHVALIDLHGNVGLKERVNQAGEAAFYGPGVWAGCIVFNRHGQVILIEQNDYTLLGENDTLRIKTAYEA